MDDNTYRQLRRNLARCWWALMALRRAMGVRP